MAASPLVGGYRLGALQRPESDRSTWLATDTRTAREALICLVPREVAAAAHRRRELSHPALTPVLDVRNNVGAVEPPAGADPRAHAFVVLPLPEGETLDVVVKRRGALRRAEAVAIVAAVADGIAAIHASGGVHGGVTPGAIELATTTGGSARVGLRGGDVALAFASPERIADGTLSRRDDGWALVAALYFAIAGRPPFAGDTDKAIMQAVLHERPASLHFETRAGTALQKILERGLLRVPSQRHPDVAALRDELRGWLAAHGGAEDEEAETTVALPSELVAAAKAVKALKTLRSSPPPPLDSDPTVPLPLPPQGGATAPRSTRAHSSRPPPLPSALPVIQKAPPSSPPSDATDLLSVEAIAQLVDDERRGATPEELAEARARLAMSPRARSEPAPSSRPIPSLDAGPAHAAPAAARPAAPEPAPAPRGSRVPLVLVALVLIAGGVVAGGRYGFLPIPALRPASPAPPPTPKVPPPTSAASSAPAPAASTSAPRAAALPSASSSANAASPSPSASAASPAASASVSAAPADVSACVARWFPGDAFATGADLGWVCAEPNALSGNKKLKRAIVVGGVGRGVTTAMLELSRYHWFELPVYATLRASCCPDGAVEIPTAIQCPSPAAPIARLAEATKKHDPIDEPLRAYHKAIACLVEHGEQGLYGESDIVHGGEEGAYRSFAARGK